jgi:hypothetical protein
MQPDDRCVVAHAIAAKGLQPHARLGIELWSAVAMGLRRWACAFDHASILERRLLSGHGDRCLSAAGANSSSAPMSDPGRPAVCRAARPGWVAVNGAVASGARDGRLDR